MSEKRFKKMDTIIDPFPIWDTLEEKGYNCTDTLDVLVDLLNELNDENNILNKNEDDLKECTIENIKLKEENEQLKEQLQMIKRIIQTQITEKEEDLRTSVKGGMPTGGLYSEIGFLKKLKKELFDDE